MRLRDLKKEVAVHEAIAEAIAAVRTRADGMATLAKRCFDYACEAKRAENGDYAEEMLKICADLELFSTELQQLALEMESGVRIASGFKRAKRLPRTFARCERILKGLPAPDMGVIGADSVAERLDKARAKLKRVRGSAQRSELTSRLEANDLGRRGTLVAPAYHATLDKKREEMSQLLAPDDEAADPVEDVVVPVAEAPADVIVLRPIDLNGLTEEDA